MTVYHCPTCGTPLTDDNHCPTCHTTTKPQETP